MTRRSPWASKNSSFSVISSISPMWGWLPRRRKSKLTAIRFKKRSARFWRRFRGCARTAEKFKVNQAEAERTYETMIGMFSRDGRLSLKVARGYLDILRQERPLPPDLDPQRFLDFSMLPPGR